MNDATERYRRHLDQLYTWLREDRRAISYATELLMRSESADERRVALKALAHVTERATWCNDRIADMTTTKAGKPCE